MMMAQATVPAVAGDLSAYFQYGIAGISLGILVFVVRILQQIQKDNADRAAAANKECADRNERTVQSVDAICDRFGETQTMTAKTFADAVGKAQDAQMTLVREHRSDAEAREQRFLQAVKDMQRPA